LKEANIPLTVVDRMTHYRLEDKIKHKVLLSFLLARVKTENEEEQEEEKVEMVAYKRLLDKVSNKIEKWHKNVV
jgi:hypothetical protein